MSPHVHTWKDSEYCRGCGEKRAELSVEDANKLYKVQELWLQHEQRQRRLRAEEEDRL